MKRVLCVGMLLAALLTAVAPAVYAACPGTCCDAKVKELVGKVLVLDLAEKLELGTEEMGILLSEFSSYQKDLADLKAKRGELKDKLMAAVESGAAGSEIDALTDEIIGLDEEIAQLKNDVLDAYSANITAEQRAMCYVFLADYDQLVCQAIQSMKQPCGAVCPAAGAVPAAAAGAAPAEAPAAAEKPEDKAMAAAKAFGEAVKSQDMDKIAACIADDFEHYEYGDKQGIVDFVQQAVDMGYLDDIEVNLEDAEPEVDGDELVVYPFELSGAFGSVTLELVFKDKGGEMKITGLDASGI